MLGNNNLEVGTTCILSSAIYAVAGMDIRKKNWFETIKIIILIHNNVERTNCYVEKVF